ncbi:MAG: ABC transporter permease subunit [Dehalogenimonas sp.]|uniref:ABC transporter permease subunit n=1 Tax=Candidatus Dehalogenimonas loeffleri TaxID=3127115 RepID=A0ABZ2J5A6_9CHLR|nr:ABC transporter permease subunit [Dehalogenimonas sp.]
MMLRLWLLELKKIFKGKSFYLVTLLLLLFTVITMAGPGDYYEHQVIATTDRMNEAIAALGADYDLVYSEALPAGFDRSRYPLRDESGNKIPGNVEVYQQMYQEYYQGQIDALTADGAEFSFSSLMSPGKIVPIMPVFAVILGVIVLAMEYNGGVYRLIIGRGVKRGDLMWAKFLALASLALLLATVLVITSFIIGLANYNSLAAAQPPVIDPGAVFEIYWVLFLLLFAYMVFGGVLGTLLASPVPALVAGVVIAFMLSQFFVYGLTPCGDDMLSAISPLTLGYNFNSLTHLLWDSSDKVECYRSVPWAVGMALAYITVMIMFVQANFGHKELKS